jgi:SAM-dependent methyltransferase
MTADRAYEAESVDLGWQPEPLWEDWPKGRDTAFVMWRMEEAYASIATKGAGGKLLDLACGDAEHVGAFHKAGWQIFGLEPSPEMIVRANERAAGVGATMPIVRGIGEVLPFKDETFDRVVCMSSLDHFANPAAGMQEMARILKRDGELVIGIVNYECLPRKGARLVYGLQRRLGIVPKGKRCFWDDPTDGEHTFEGGIKSVSRHGRGVFELKQAYGVSMLWGFPGWHYVFRLMPGESKIARNARDVILKSLDAVARRFPSQSDFLVLTFKRTA